jgi:hypothetical protein
LGVASAIKEASVTKRWSAPKSGGYITKAQASRQQRRWDKLDQLEQEIDALTFEVEQFRAEKPWRVFPNWYYDLLKTTDK